MARDPYQVLGVPHTATQDEISKAYKKLAKKYHPDLHPNDTAAEAKMREINEAYNSLRNGGADYHADYGRAYERGYGSYGSYTDYGGYSGYGDSRSGYSRYQNVRDTIRMGRNAEALRMLEQMNTRDAEWYYLCGVANYNLGNRASAVSYAAMAVQREPSNAEYVSFFNRISAEGSRYQQRSSTFNVPMGRFCSYCTSMAICMCFGGRCIPCCW